MNKPEQALLTGNAVAALHVQQGASRPTKRMGLLEQARYGSAPRLAM